MSKYYLPIVTALLLTGGATARAQSATTQPPAATQPPPASTTKPATTTTTTSSTTTATTAPPATTATPGTTPPVPATTSTTTTSTTTTAPTPNQPAATTITTVTTSTTTTAPPPLVPPPPPTAVGLGNATTHKFGRQQLVQGVVWRGTASLGFSATTGNSNVLSVSGSALVSRNDGWNKIALGAEGVYGITRLIVLNDANGNGVADNRDEVGEQQTTTAAFFTAWARYDRFFTPNNSGYLVAISGFDFPASLQAKVGAQVGYARQLAKTQMHELSAEVGYDFTYDRLIPPPMAPPTFVQNVLLHSMRLFLGYVLTVSTHTTIRANIEALINLNSVFIADREVDSGYASRVKGKLEFTTRIWKPLSFRASFLGRYNNAPALNRIIPFSPDNPARYNQTFDTLTELGIVVQFL